MISALWTIAAARSALVGDMVVIWFMVEKIPNRSLDPIRSGRVSLAVPKGKGAALWIPFAVGSSCRGPFLSPHFVPVPREQARI